MAERVATRRPRPEDGHADQVRALFDSKAAGWPGKYAADGRLAGRLAALTAAVRGRVPAGGELLDLGCGSGDLARHLAAEGYRVTGCDANVYPPMSEQLSALGIELIEGYSDDQLALRPDVWVIGSRRR